MIIDAHQHIWDPGRAAYDWLGPELAPVDRAFALDEALGSMRRAGVAGTVLVQAADNDEDTELMIAAADQHPAVVGIVAWVPLDDPRRTAERLESFADDPRIVGIRTLIHGRDDLAWLLRPEVQPGLAAVAASGLPYDYVTSGPVALAHVPAIVARHPELGLVIDHLGKPPIGADDGARRHWRGLLTEAARSPRVFAKLSGLYSSVGAMSDWTPELVRPFVHDALEIFGPDRLMFGSDWPISVLAGGYDRVWDGLAELFAEHTPSDRSAILGDTAAAYYSLNPAVLAAAAVSSQREDTP